MLLLCVGVSGPSRRSGKIRESQFAPATQSRASSRPRARKPDRFHPVLRHSAPACLHEHSSVCVAARSNMRRRLKPGKWRPLRQVCAQSVAFAADSRVPAEDPTTKQVHSSFQADLGTDANPLTKPIMGPNCRIRRVLIHMVLVRTSPL